MEQNPMTVVTEVRPDCLEKLKTYLKPIGDDIKNNNVIQFSAFQNLHYCCFIIIEDENPPTGSEKANPILAFEAKGRVHQPDQLLVPAEAVDLVAE